MMTERVLCLEDRGVKHSNLKTGAPDEREAHQPAAPADARGYERPPVHARYATRVHPSRQEAGGFPRPVPRHGDPGRAARVPAVSDRDGCAADEHQRDRDGAALLLQGDARSAADDTASGVRLLTTQAPARA